MIIDQNRCIGCDCCTIACIKENNTPYHWIEVETLNTPNKDTPQGKFPELTMDFLPKLCNHCSNPPCVSACPVDAIQKREDGIVVILKEHCDGCQLCLNACPYGIIKFNDVMSVAEKCNFCVHRVEQGLEPFCVTCCEGQAIYFGDINDKECKISQLLVELKTFVLLPEKGTDPNVYYIPPRPRKRF